MRGTGEPPITNTNNACGSHPQFACTVDSDCSLGQNGVCTTNTCSSTAHTCSNDSRIRCSTNFDCNTCSNDPATNCNTDVDCNKPDVCTAIAEKTFVVDGVNTVMLPNPVNPLLAPTRYIKDGQLRVALSWPDPPNAVLGTSANGGSGTLVNDLDLEVESPGPDNCQAPGDIGPGGVTCPAASAADNIIYDGNVYILGKALTVGQWSQGRPRTQTAVHDKRNNIEAVHLSTFVDRFLANSANQLVTGNWKVRVKRGAGGATAGQITMINGTNEDVNGNGRLDTGEDTSNSQCVASGNPAPCCTGAGTGTCTGNGNGLLDAGGQPYALVVSGPVLGTPGQTQTWNSASHALASSTARLHKYQYSCSDSAVGTELAPALTGAAGASAVSANAVFQV